MRTFKFIKDPRAFEVVADETRRRMIYLLRVKEMTVSQIADALDKTPQAIYHQIKKLQETGLVEVAREERVDHFIETYYRATAEVFEFTHGDQSSDTIAADLRDTMQTLSTIGIQVNATEDLISLIAEIERRQGSLSSISKELEEKIAGLEDAGFHTKQHAYKILQMALMSDKEFEQMQSDERRFRELAKKSLASPAIKAHTRTAKRAP